jgi:hypothetical protein
LDDRSISSWESGAPAASARRFKASAASHLPPHVVLRDAAVLLVVLVLRALRHIVDKGAVLRD